MSRVSVLSYALRIAPVAAALAICLSPPVSAEEHDNGIPFRPLGVGVGPSIDIVTDIYQDRAGFVWVASRKGLFLYDGYSFREFEHDVSDPSSLADNDLRRIYEDRAGNIWIGTNTGGLDRLDRSSWTFEHFRHDSSDPGSLSHDSVYAIAEDAEGNLWVGTQVGLNRLDVESGRFERYVSDEGDPASLRNDFIIDIHPGEDGSLWLASLGGGLARLLPDGELTFFTHDPEDETTVATDAVHAIAPAPNGDLWVGSAAGIQRLDVETGRFSLLGDAETPGTGLGYELVSRITVDEALRPWIATWGGGVSRFDPDTGRFDHYQAGRERDEQPIDRVLAILVDREQNVWIGTWGAGINRMSAALVSFEFIGQTGSPEGISYRDAMSVIEDSRGTLWIGTFGGGLNRRNRGDGEFRIYADEGAARTVHGIVEAADGSIWWGAIQGLHRLDPETGAIDSMFADADDPSALGPGYVMSVFVDSGGALWAGTGEGGLHRLRADGKSFDRFPHDPEDERSLSDNFVTRIFEDRSGRLWIGTRSGGLNLMNRETGEFQRFLPDPGDDSTLSHHFVSSIVESSGGDLWVGTWGGGFNRIAIDEDASTVAFERFSELDGLVDDNVTSLLVDDDDSLWITTRSGLSRFDPGSRRFTSFDGSDGLPSNEFNYGSHKGEENLYFGSTNGVLVVPRGTPYPAEAASPTVFTEIRTLDGPLKGESPAWELGDVSVPHGEILTFEFAVLDLDATRRHRYEYRFAEGRNGWIDLGDRRQLTFTDLDPGTHLLTVRGRNRHGIWSETPQPLAIEVVPPFWMTWWFRLAAIAVVGLAVVVGHIVRTASLRSRNRALVRLKGQRERALDEAHTAQEALQVAYDRLRDLTRRLEAAKEDERKRIARELHDEMGQALTAAKINLQLIDEKTSRESRGRRITDTIDLVDRMIGHVRALSLDLRPPLLDELGLVPALRGYLEAQARRTRIEIELDAPESTAGLDAAVEITAFRVVQEAITNVIRHARASRVEVLLRRQNGSLEVSVHDDGEGFDVDDLQGFDPGGEHLGLLGIRERVESIGGQVVIESSPSSGTQIVARVPVAA